MTRRMDGSILEVSVIHHAMEGAMAKKSSGILGATAGSIIGVIVAGPAGFILGAAIGGAVTEGKKSTSRFSSDGWPADARLRKNAYGQMSVKGYYHTGNDCD